MFFADWLIFEVAIRGILKNVLSLLRKEKPLL